jgi:hypothetical protein
VRPAPFTMAAIAEAETGQAVKPGAGHTPAGCSQAGQPGNGALEHLEGAGERLASTGGWRPRTPDTPSEQGRRALTARGSGSRGVSARTRRSTGRCGWTNFLQQMAKPDKGRAVWQKCGARECAHCGPELRERDLGHDVANMAGRRMTRRVVAKAAWAAVRAKIKRAGGLRVAYPQPGGMVAVYATAGLTGAVVEDHAASLAADYGRIPAGQRIGRSRAWALRAAGGKDRPAAWRSLGKSRIPAQVPDILRRLGLYRDEVNPEGLSAQAWEAHDFTVPEQDSPAFDRFAYEVGLHRSHRGRRRREAA